jgi:hypothetical protein
MRKKAHIPKQAMPYVSFKLPLSSLILGYRKTGFPNKRSNWATFKISTVLGIICACASSSAPPGDRHKVIPELIRPFYICWLPGPGPHTLLARPRPPTPYIPDLQQDEAKKQKAKKGRALGRGDERVRQPARVNTSLCSNLAHRAWQSPPNLFCRRIRRRHPAL